MILPNDIREIVNEISGGEVKLIDALSDRGIAPLDFFQYLDANPEAKLLFTRAREVAAEMNLDELRGSFKDRRFMAKEELDVIKAKIALGTWFAEKLLPKQYGTKIEHNVNETINIRHIIEEANKRVESASIPTTARPVIEIEKIEKKDDPEDYL